MSFHNDLDPSKIQPSTIIVTVGQNVSFQCLTTNRAKWYFNDGNLQNNTEQHNNILYINQVVQLNSGYYECASTYRNGSNFFARGFLKVTGRKSP